MNLLRLLSGLVVWCWAGDLRAAKKRFVCGDRHDDPKRASAPEPSGGWFVVGDRVQRRGQSNEGTVTAVCQSVRVVVKWDDRPDTELFGESALSRAKPRPRSPYRHGWYSVENDKSLGHYYCTLASGGTVMVTNVTQAPTGGLAGWPDAVYRGEVVPPDEGGIQRQHDPFGAPWTPPWAKRV